eukprot:TRINITY_DN38624_c0_g1_i1.p1 TRINITY_DN38624_c0_g1~~TRINITY_DN38624_c0_g1_i1.p1  ORF type:complete len:144 (+),score=24.46 TRINITY_DN38624_c0_g1_i1:37-468(+)
MLCASTSLLCLYSFFFFLMIRRPPRSTLSSSSAASDVYKRQPLLRIRAAEDLPLERSSQSCLRGDGRKLFLGPTDTVWTFDLGRARGGVVGKSKLSSSPTRRAVSYTHLRAHETPEHLVCRLLLEKKNEGNNKFYKRWELIQR